MRFLPRLSEQRLQDLLVYALPTLFVPLWRFVKDQDNPNRQVLYVRDLLSYGAGAVAYFGLKLPTLKLLARKSSLPQGKQNLLGTLVGSVASIVISSIGVLDLTNRISTWAGLKSGEPKRPGGNPAPPPPFPAVPGRVPTPMRPPAFPVSGSVGGSVQPLSV